MAAPHTSGGEAPKHPVGRRILEQHSNLFLSGFLTAVTATALTVSAWWRGGFSKHSTTEVAFDTGIGPCGAKIPTGVSSYHRHCHRLPTYGLLQAGERLPRLRGDALAGNATMGFLLCALGLP